MHTSLRAVRKHAIFAALLTVAGLAGCSGTGKSAIEPGADEVESGRGVLDYEAQRDGEVFVYDAETDSTDVASSAVGSGVVSRSGATRTSHPMFARTSSSERPGCSDERVISPSTNV